MILRNLSLYFRFPLPGVPGERGMRQTRLMSKNQCSQILDHLVGSLRIGQLDKFFPSCDTGQRHNGFHADPFRAGDIRFQIVADQYAPLGLYRKPCA